MNTSSNDKFLHGGGEMGEIIRNFNWNETSLGEPSSWPLSLRTTIGIMLHSSFPMFLFWGEDLLCFYNDAYRPCLGNQGKHSLIGKKAKEAWPEIWDFLCPILEKVRQSGESTFFENQLVPIYRNGHIEDVYWTFSHSPAYGDSGQINGVFVTCSETTSQVINLQKITASNEKLKQTELFSNDIFYNSPVAKLVVTGSEMTISRINENMLKMLGRENDIVGATLFGAIPELFVTPLKERLLQVFTTGETLIQDEEKIKLNRYGEWYTGYYKLIYKPAFSVSGQILGIMITAMEITKQVISRHLIEKKEEELRALINATPVGICVLDSTTNFVQEVNDKFLLIWGKCRSTVLNKNYWEAFQGAFFYSKEELENVFVTGQKFSSIEYEINVERDGIIQNIFVKFEYVPTFDENQKVAKVILLALEITPQVEARKQIEEKVRMRTRELAELNISLKRSNSELEQFAYIASHDLQEPVRKISIFLEMLQKSLGTIPESSQMYFTKIFSSTTRMTKLIRDVLAYSQVTNDTAVFSLINLNTVIDELRSDFELTIREKNAIIEVSNLPIIYGLKCQMIQLFGNLFSNSLKFARPDVPLSIYINSKLASKIELKKHPQLSQNKKYYHIEFSDNGIGFDEEYSERIFKIFQRLHVKNDYEGTGIGLAICRKILQSHHGEITAEKSKYGGAKFSIFFPVYIDSKKISENDITF